MKKNNEDKATFKANRMVIDVLLTRLKEEKLTSDQKDKIVSEINEILDMDAKSRKSECEFEKTKGRLTGQINTIFTFVGGFVIGKLIKQYFIK